MVSNIEKKDRESQNLALFLAEAYFKLYQASIIELFESVKG